MVYIPETFEFNNAISIQPMSIEARFISGQIYDSRFLGIKGKCPLGEKNLFTASFMTMPFKYDVYDTNALFVKEETVSLWAGSFGYRYQLWDVDKAYMSLGGRIKTDGEITAYDIDVTVFDVIVDENFNTNLILGLQDGGALSGQFIAVNSKIVKKIGRVDIYLKLTYRKNVTFNSGIKYIPSLRLKDKSAGFFLGVEQNAFKGISLNLGIQLFWSRIADILIGTKTDAYLGGGMFVDVGYRKVIKSFEVENILKDFEILKRKVEENPDFLMGKGMIDSIESLLQTESYPYAAFLIEELKQYLKEYEK